MPSFFAKVDFYVRRYLFEQFAIPSVRHENISKIILKKYLPDNPVIIDCGSHDGSDSVQLAKIFPKGSVHAFEPVQEVYDRLIENAKPFKNITCYQLALADKDGSMDFYVSQGASDGSSSLMEPKDHLVNHPDTFFQKKLKVETSTLDSWAIKHKISNVDMLWLDMQGFEYNMLAASEFILKKVSVIHSEVSLRETYKDVIQYKGLRSFLELHGFKVVIEAIPLHSDMGNVLFVRNIR